MSRGARNEIFNKKSSTIYSKISFRGSKTAISLGSTGGKRLDVKSLTDEEDRADDN